MELFFITIEKKLQKSFFELFYLMDEFGRTDIFFSYFSLNKSRNVFIEEELLIWLDYTETATTYTQFFFFTHVNYKI